ncbi:MAG: nuclear transport factor 2 family protein [Gemmatimonadetes bacterium]|nr:nuclear transport factor 2 family protein [Gemmatimonadota bacterium]
MTPLETVQRFVSSINAHDIAALSALVTRDHRFVDSLGAVVAGREAMREGWRRYFQMVPDYHIEVTRSFADGLEVVLLGSAGGTYCRDGRPSSTGPWRIPAAWRAAVRAGLVAEWQVFADNDPIRQQMARAST